MKTATSRPRLSVTTDGKGVVGHAGARLLVDLAKATGLTGAFGEAPAPSRRRGGGHDPGRVAVDLTVMLADGGESISDLALLRDQSELFGPVPRSDRAVGGGPVRVELELPTAGVFGQLGWDVEQFAADGGGFGLVSLPSRARSCSQESRSEARASRVHQAWLRANLNEGSRARVKDFDLRMPDSMWA